MSEHNQAAEATVSADASAELQSGAPAASADGAPADGERQAVDESASQPSEEEKQNKNRERFDRRFSDLTRRAREAELRAARLEGELSALRNGVRPQAQEQAPAPAPRRGPPDPKDYPAGKFDERYVEDFAAWKAEETVAKALETREEQARREAAERAREQAFAENAKRFHATLREADELGYEGGQAYLHALDRVGLHDVIDDITEATHKAHVAEWLSRNPDTAEQLERASPRKRAQFIGALDADIGRVLAERSARPKQTQQAQPSANPAPKPSPAPTPQVNGSGAAPTKDPNRMSMEEFAAWRNAQMGVTQ